MLRSMAELIGTTIAFIALSGLWAMIDAAILSVSPAEVEVMIAKKRWGARDLQSLLKHTTRAIIVIVILTNMTNILGPILIGRKAETLFGSTGIGIVTALLTFLTIIASEIIPKSIGAHYAPRIARSVAPILRALIVILYPIVLLLERIVKVFKTGKRKIGTEDQIRALANLGGGAGHIDSDERELIHRAFVLNDTIAKNVMTPTEKIASLRLTTTVWRASVLVFEQHFSRYPVLSDSGKKSIGYVLSKDILESLADGDDDATIENLIRPIEIVSPDMRCDDLLDFLRKNMTQIALVGTSENVIGVVTLEDVLEELVGEIRDEGDSGE